jgi:hypothetical protein
MVRAEIESVHAHGGERSGSRHHVIDGPAEGEDGPMVVRVSVHIEQGRGGRSSQFSQYNRVAALTDVDHALDDHGDQFARLAARGLIRADLADRDGLRHPAATQDATALSLRASTPHAVVDVVLEGVFEAGRRDGAVAADLLRYQHSHPVTREEDVRCDLLAFPPGHPFSIHFAAPFSRLIVKKKGC